MPVTRFSKSRLWFWAVPLALLASQAHAAQSRGGTPASQQVTPVNTGDNPFTATRDWAKLTIEGRPWGSSNGVEVDRDGKTVWAVERCVGSSNPGCVGTLWNPIHHFDENGKEIASFGGGMFAWPHAIHMDPDNNLWVVDSRATTPEELKKWPLDKPRGSAVYKFDRNGKLLLTIGKRGVVGNPPGALFEPIDIVSDPANGDVYITEGHGEGGGGDVARISVFTKNGKYLRSFGKVGQGPGEFRIPHSIVMDSQGRLIVADRGNHRVQIVTKDGKFVQELFQFSRASGLAIDKNDFLYATDSESSPQNNPGWVRAIRGGSLKDGKITVVIPLFKAAVWPDGVTPEGLALDPQGNLFTAEARVGFGGVTKHTHK